MSSPQRIISDTNKAPLVQVLTLMFLVIAILACVVRISTKVHMVKSLKVDDILVIVSTVSLTIEAFSNFFNRYRSCRGVGVRNWPSSSHVHIVRVWVREAVQLVEPTRS
jgi:phosphatidylglycerophosphate synthase